MKTPIQAVSCRVTTEWWNEGSVLRGDYRTGIDAIHCELEVESDAPATAVGKLIAMSERACYVFSAFDRPPSPRLNVTLNGEPFPIPQD
jgi:hypothetical protein